MRRLATPRLGCTAIGLNEARLAAATLMQERSSFEFESRPNPNGLSLSMPSTTAALDLNVSLELCSQIQDTGKRCRPDTEDDESEEPRTKKSASDEECICRALMAQESVLSEGEADVSRRHASALRAVTTTERKLAMLEHRIQQLRRDRNHAHAIVQDLWQYRQTDRFRAELIKTRDGGSRSKDASWLERWFSASTGARRKRDQADTELVLAKSQHDTLCSALIDQRRTALEMQREKDEMRAARAREHHEEIQQQVREKAVRLANLMQERML